MRVRVRVSCDQSEASIIYLTKAASLHQSEDDGSFARSRSSTYQNTSVSWQPRGESLPDLMHHPAPASEGSWHWLRHLKIQRPGQVMD